MSFFLLFSKNTSILYFMRCDYITDYMNLLIKQIIAEGLPWTWPNAK